MTKEIELYCLINVFVNIQKKYIYGNNVMISIRLGLKKKLKNCILC